MRSSTIEKTTSPVYKKLDHLAILKPGEWGVWRYIFVRAAGFPGQDILKLASPQCATAADCLIDAEHDFHRRCEVTAEQLLSETEGADPAIRRDLVKAARKLRRHILPKELETLKQHNGTTEQLILAFQQLEASRNSYSERFAEAENILLRSLREIAQEERFREAILWQNRHALKTGIDVFLRRTEGSSKRNFKVRRHEQLVASYFQRYCTKNDTVGFFGPVSWAEISPHGDPVVISCGADMVTSRQVFFEDWCIDTVAHALEEDASLRAWLRPWKLPYFHLEGDIYNMAGAPPITLSREQLAVFAACDGRSMAIDIARSLIEDASFSLSAEQDVFAILDDFKNRGMIAWNLQVPIDLNSERIVREQLESIDDEDLRTSKLEALTHIEKARDAMGNAHGDLAKLEKSIEELEEAFTRLTIQKATRFDGEAYGGRTLAYEDCRRDISIEIGPQLIEELARPTALLLSSARWFTHQVSQSYQPQFRKGYEDLVEQMRTPQVGLLEFFSFLRPIMPRVGSDPIADFTEDLRQRWAEVLSLPSGERKFHYTSNDLETRAKEIFNAPGPGWRSARHQSIDVLIDAPSIDAIRDGDYRIVLGEIHLASHMFRQSIVNQHPNPEVLLEALTQDLPGPSLIPLQPKIRATNEGNPLGIPDNSARLFMAPLKPNDYRILVSDEPPDFRRKTFFIGEFVVTEKDDSLVVATRDGNYCFDIMEFFDSAMTTMAVDSFKLLPAWSHVPRISIDRMVIQRETWRPPLREAEFTRSKSDSERFFEARKWARRYDMPRFVFVASPFERKSVFVDFDSPHTVNILAKMSREALRQGPEEVAISVTEMLPDLHHLWFPDAQDRRYTSELRFVASDLSQRT